MAEGFFIVREDDGNPRDIVFETKVPGGKPPEDQLALKSEIERTLVVLRMLFEGDDKKFQQAFRPLLALAQAGLVGPAAQPEVARLALIELQKEVTSREAGNVKNQYLRTLGVKALLFGGVLAALALIAHYFIHNDVYANFLTIELGCMVGVWLSFGARKTVLGFYDLNILETDRLEPPIRLIFAGLLTLILGLLFFKQAIVVSVGAVTTAKLGEDAVVAFIVGCLAGFSELALPSKVAKQAALFMDQE